MAATARITDEVEAFVDASKYVIDPRVEKYADVLPANEYAALSWWTGSFYDFQRDWLLEEQDFAIANKSRQIGTSHTTAAIGVFWGAFLGELTTIISIGETESKEVLDKCKKHVAVLRDLGSAMAKTTRSNETVIEFASGGRIIALPASGGRSFSGNVFLDEYAYQQHATKVWDAAAPVTLLPGNKMRVVSTPNGIGNEFYDLWDIATNVDRRDRLPEIMKGVQWAAHKIPIELAIAQGYPVDLARCWQLAKGDPRLFDQMFNCSFLDNVLQYISGDLINDCLTNDRLTSIVGDEHYAGLDIGREADLTVLVVVRRVKAVSYVVHVESMKRTDGEGLAAMIDRAFARYKLKRLCIDSTGLGTFPAEAIKKKHSEKIDVPHRRPRVECIDFTPNSKEALATGLYSVMSNQLVQLPSNDNALPAEVGYDATAQRKFTINAPGTAAALKREIASVQRVITTSGNVTYTTPRTSDGHADRAWALMLALHARSATNPMVDALRARMAGGAR